MYIIMLVKNIEFHTSRIQENIETYRNVSFSSRNTRIVSLVRLTSICEARQEMQTNVTNIAVNSYPSLHIWRKMVL